MRAHREILALKLATFDPCFVHIFVKYQGIELEILPQYPHYSPNIYAPNFSPFVLPRDEIDF